jgi:hypothetical protein
MYHSCIRSSLHADQIHHVASYSIMIQDKSALQEVADSPSSVQLAKVCLIVATSLRQFFIMVANQGRSTSRRIGRESGLGWRGVYCEAPDLCPGVAGGPLKCGSASKRIRSTVMTALRYCCHGCTAVVGYNYG